MSEPTEGQVVAHRLIRGPRGHEHARVYRHTGRSALRRKNACGSQSVIEFHSGYPAGDRSWYPRDDGKESVASDLIRHARQGYLVCQSCLHWAYRNGGSAAEGTIRDSSTGSET